MIMKHLIIHFVRQKMSSVYGSWDLGLHSLMLKIIVIETSLDSRYEDNYKHKFF